MTIDSYSERLLMIFLIVSWYSGGIPDSLDFISRIGNIF
jgi:hypothetical protein